MRILLLLAMAAGASLIGSNCGGSGVGDPCVPEDEYLTTFSGFAVGEVNVESRSFQCLTRVCLVNHFQGRVSCPFGQVEDEYNTQALIDAGCGPIEGSGRAKCAALNVAEPGTPPDFRCADADATPTSPADVDGNGCLDSGSLCADSTCAPGGAEHERACRVPDRDGTELEDRIQVPVDAQFTSRRSEDTVYCSCRCAGPDPSARYCSCPSGFVCEPLVDDLGLGEKGQLAGSYCIRSGTRYEAAQHPGGFCGPGQCGEDVERALGGVATPVARNNGTTCEAAGTICYEDIYCCDPAVPNQNTNPDEGPVAVNKPFNVGRQRCSEVGTPATLNDGSVVTVCPGTPPGG